MHFDLSKPQKLLQQSVRDFCKRECPTSRVRELIDSENGFDPALWTEIADQGWIGLHLPEKYDGLGLSAVELVVVAEELGRCCLPGPWLSSNWAATLLAAIGGSAAETHLPKIIEGAELATVAVLEAELSWDISSSAPQTTLASDSLQGTKRLVMNAAEASVILCLARQDKELCLVAVPGDADGLRVTATRGIDPTRRLYQCDLDNIAVAAGGILASGDAALQAWERTHQLLALVVSAEMLGAMQWMMETTVEYAKTRKQFDQPIGSFQTVQTKCADMLLMTESARSAVWYAAWALQEERPDARRAVSVAKAYLSEAARTVGNLSVQSHGGIGFTWEHDLQLFYKRVRANEFLFGDAACHHEAIAELVLQ